MAVNVFPQPVPYNKRALPPVEEPRGEPPAQLPTLHRNTRTLTEFLTRELSSVERAIAATGRTPSRTVTADVIATESDGFLAVDATAGAVTVTLPSAWRYAGRIFYVKKVDASANTVTVEASGTDTIDGAASVALSGQYESVELYAQPDLWFVLSQANIVPPGAITGSGTTGTLPVFTGTSSIGNSIVSQSGTTATVAGSVVPSTANARDLGSTAAPWRSGYLGTSLGVGFTGAISSDVNADIVSKLGIRPSVSVAYPTTLTNGFAGRFYAVHDAGDWGFVIARAANDEFAANLTLYHTRSATGARTALVNGDQLARITFQGVSQTGGTVNTGASIIAAINGVVSNGVLPTQLEFRTATSGNAIEGVNARWIMQAAGHWVPGTTNAVDIGTTALRPATIYGVNLNVSGNTTLGDAAGDTLTIAPSAVTWSNNPTHSGNHTFSGNVSVNGNTTLGNATTDTITPTGRFAADLDPNANNTIDLGASGLAYKDGWFAGTLNTADLDVTDDSFLDGDVTFGGPWQHPEVVTGTFTIAAAHNGALLGSVSIAGDIDVAGTLAVLP